VRQYDRPEGTSDATVAALGTLSEALEYVERVRGHLYSLHQLMGRADLLFGEAADLLADAGHVADADELRCVVVGRNLLHGRWTFQVVDEFDDVYYRLVRDHVLMLEARHMGGRRHVYEAEMKEERRTKGAEGHEARP
jgi:hypothetical protein